MNLTLWVIELYRCGRGRLACGGKCVYKFSQRFLRIELQKDCETYNWSTSHRCKNIINIFRFSVGYEWHLTAHYCAEKEKIKAPKRKHTWNIKALDNFNRIKFAFWWSLGSSAMLNVLLVNCLQCTYYQCHSARVKLKPAQDGSDRQSV